MPVRRAGTEHHLERPAEAPVGDAEPEQGLAPRRPHRSEILQRHADAAADLPGEIPIRDPRVHRPGAPLRIPATEDEVGVAGHDRVDDECGVARVERAVGVHEAHDIGRGRHEPGPARGAESSQRFDHDGGAVSARDVGGPVGGAVVDDDRPHPVGDAAEDPGQRVDLVEHGEDEVDDAPTVAVAVGLGVWLALVAVSVVWGRQLLDSGHDIAVRAAPLYGRWRAVLGWENVPGLIVAGAVVTLGPRLARSCAWRLLLALSAATSVSWAVSLAVVDGVSAVRDPLESRHEHLPFARDVGDVGELLRTFVDRLPEHPIHVQGHPPGTTVILTFLDRAGLAGSGWIAALALGGGAVAVVASLVLCRSLAGEGAARRAAPFVAVLPAAVWVATTMDALYAGVAVALVAVLGLEVARDRPRGSVLAVTGAGFGVAINLSYGLALLGPIAVALLWWRRRLVALVPLAVGAVAVVVAFGAAGFWWWEGLRATHEAYVDGVASRRPYSYFLLANLGAVALAVGPAVVAGIVAARGRLLRVVVPAAAAVLVADLTGLAKGEVERIWLFLVIPLGLGAGSLARTRRWLAVHLAAGLVLSAMLRTPW